MQLLTVGLEERRMGGVSPTDRSKRVKEHGSAQPVSTDALRIGNGQGQAITERNASEQKERRRERDIAVMVGERTRRTRGRDEV